MCVSKYVKYRVVQISDNEVIICGKGWTKKIFAVGIWGQHWIVGVLMSDYEVSKRASQGTHAPQALRDYDMGTH